MSTQSLATRVHNRPRRYSDEQLLERLRTCAKELGRTPGSAAFDRWLEHKGSQLLVIRFTSWAQACEAAGLSPNPRVPSKAFGKARYSEADVVRAYERIRGLVEGPPSIGEWSKLRVAGEPTAHIIRRRYGNSWLAFLRALEKPIPVRS